MAGRMGNSSSDDDDYFEKLVEADEDLQGFKGQAHILAPAASRFGSSAASAAPVASAAMPIQRRARKSKKINQDQQIMKAYVIAYIQQNIGSAIDWLAISALLREQQGIEITKKALREKWVNYLNPTLYDGPFSQQELNILRDLYLESLQTKQPSPLTGYYPLPRGLKWATVINMLAQYTPSKRGENPVKNKFNSSQKFWVVGRDPAPDSDVGSDVDDDGGGGDVVDMDHDIAGSPEFSPERSGSQGSSSQRSSQGSVYQQSQGEFSGSPGFTLGSFPNSPAFGQGASGLLTPTSVSVSRGPPGSPGFGGRKTSMKSHRKSSRKSYRKSSRKARKSSRKARKSSSRKARKSSSRKARKSSSRKYKS
jgi:hypothetical protein